METTLHRQLKALYAVGDARQEVQFEGFRIDAIRAGELIEIQQASLGALRQKTRSLLEGNHVRIVKPLALRKRIVHHKARGIPVGKGRMSPLHEGWLHVFDDLVHFIDVFPHPRLILDVVLTEQVELRTPRTPPRRFGRNYRVTDRKLTAVLETKTLRTTFDLAALLPANLPSEFTTEELSKLGAIPRWLSQRIAYCLRKSGAALPVGKRRNAWVYALQKGPVEL